MVVQSEQETLLHNTVGLPVVIKSTDPTKTQIYLVSNICSGLMSRPLGKSCIGPQFDARLSPLLFVIKFITMPDYIVVNA